MGKISLEEFAGVIRKDEALNAKIAACTDPDSAAEALRALASEMGYELYSERPSGKQAFSDDDLSDVAGGRNILSGNNSGVLYPYSWFVTILRLLSKSDEGDSDPNASDTYPTPTPDPSKR